MESKELGTLGVYFETEAAQKKIKELKEQLAEKDKEILVLKSFIKRNIPNDYAEIKAIKNIHDLDDDGFIVTLDDFYIINECKIRHQVCEEIRDWYREQDLIIEVWLKDCLNQIEKGESDEKIKK